MNAQVHRVSTDPVGYAHVVATIRVDHIRQCHIAVFVQRGSCWISTPTQENAFREKQLITNSIIKAHCRATASYCHETRIENITFLQIEGDVVHVGNVSEGSRKIHRLR